jgi:hypothetical protein
MGVIAIIFIVIMLMGASYAMGKNDGMEENEE